MESLFENTYLRTKKTAEELYSYFSFFKPLSLILNIIIGIALIVSVIGYIAGIMRDISFLYIFVAVFYCIMRAFTYFYSVKVFMKRDAEISNGEGVTVDITVTDEAVSAAGNAGDGSHGVNSVTYDMLKYCVRTKNHILLLTKANLVYIFRSDSFTKGTPEEMLVFLKSKGVRIRKSMWSR